MSRRIDERRPDGRVDPDQRTEQPAWIAGTVVFAGVMMIMTGVFQFLNGLAAAETPELFVAPPEHLYDLNVRVWGWVHVVSGVVIGLAGLAVFTGRVWARVVGILLATVSLTTNFMFIPYSPVWSLLVIAVNVMVVYALAVVGRRPVF